MKKFLSLFCALVVVLSASALPIKQMAVSASQQKTMPQLKADAKQMKAEHMAKASHILARTAAGKSVAKVEPKTMAAKVLRVKAGAPAEVVAVKVNAKYYEEDGDWFCALTADTTIYRFDFPGADPAGVEYNKEYTLADMDANYSWEGPNNYSARLYTAATFKRTKGEFGDCYEATVSFENGAIHHVVYTAQPKPEAKDTVELIFEDIELSDLTSSYGYFDMVGEDETYSVTISVNADQVIGVYGEGDVDVEYSAISILDAEGVPHNIDLMYGTGEVTSGENGGYIGVFDLMTVDTILYHVTMMYVVSEVTDTVKIVADNLRIEDFLGLLYFFTAETEEYYVSLNAYEKFGNFAFGDFEGGISVLAEEKDYDALDGAISVEEKGDTILLTGYIICKNGVRYELELYYAKPTDPTRSVTFDVEATMVDALLEQGAYALQGYSADGAYMIGLVITGAESYDGEFTTENIDAEQTAVYEIDINDPEMQVVELYNFISGSATATLNEAGDSIFVTAKLLMQGYLDNTDIPEFNVTMKAKIPTGMTYDNDEEGIEATLALTEGDINSEYFEEYGVVLVEATDNETGLTISLEMYTDNLDPISVLPAGEYLVDYSYNPGTVGGGEGVFDGYIYGSLVSYTDEQGYFIDPWWWIVEGTVTVETVEDKLKITVDALNSNELPIKVVMLSEGFPEGVENVNAAVKAVKMVKNGNLVIKKNGVEYNVLGAQL